MRVTVASEEYHLLGCDATYADKAHRCFGGSTSSMFSVEEEAEGGFEFLTAVIVMSAIYCDWTTSSSVEAE
jgi:hypothetical protein